MAGGHPNLSANERLSIDDIMETQESEQPQEGMMEITEWKHSISPRVQDTAV